MQRHVAVIDPGMRVGELDCFNRMSRFGAVPLTYHLPAMFGLDSLHRASDGVAGVIVLGSGASVNDDLAWLSELDAWLLPRLTAGTPTLGLCFGHQLIARLLGGRVGPLFPDRRKLKGFRRITLAANRLWGDAQDGEMLVTHAEAVLALPDGLEAVGRSDVVDVEALGHRELPIWGFQAHAEATEAFAANNRVPIDGVDAGAWAFGHRIVDAFLSRCAAGRE